MFALGQKFRSPIGMSDRLRTCRHDCARRSSAQPTEPNQVLMPAPRHSDQAQESSGVTHWVYSLAFLPASGFLQGIDYLARHIALIMFGKDRVCGESAARPEPAFCYYTLPFPEQVGHDALIVHGHISLAVGQGEAHLQIVAALYAAWFHQPADSHARPWRDMLFGEVSRRIKENNRIAESAKHQRDRNGKHTETCPDQDQSSLLAGHLVSSLRAPGSLSSSIRRSRDIRRRGRGPRYDRGCRHGLLCARLVGNASVINILLVSGEEVPYRRCYLFCMGFERKVTSVEEMNDRGRNVALKGLGTGGQEERVVLPPCRQERRLVRAEIFLESRIKGNVAFVVTEQVQLDLVRTWARQVEVVERIAVGRNRTRVRYAMCVLPARCFRSEERTEGIAVGLRGLLPVCSDRIPPVA